MQKVIEYLFTKNEDANKLSFSTQNFESLKKDPFILSEIDNLSEAILQTTHNFVA